MFWVYFDQFFCPCVNPSGLRQTFRCSGVSTTSFSIGTQVHVFLYYSGPPALIITGHITGQVYEESPGCAGSARGTHGEGRGGYHL